MRPSMTHTKSRKVRVPAQWWRVFLACVQSLETNEETNRTQNTKKYKLSLYMKPSQENKYQTAKKDVEAFQSSTKLLYAVLLVRERASGGYRPL